MIPESVRVLVVGAGPAGATLAWHLARSGVPVLGVDARPLDQAGPGHVNSIPLRLVQAAGWGPLRPDEVASPMGDQLLVAGGASTRLTGFSLAEVWMRRLVSRLQREAVEAGAILLGQTRFVDVAGEGPLEVTLEGEGGRTTVRAHILVDASGLAGAVRSRWAPLAACCPPVPDRDLCLALDRVRRVRDPGAVSRWLEGQGVTWDRGILSRTALAGSMSLQMVGWHGPFLGLLTASVLGEDVSPASSLMQELEAQIPGLGEVELEGGGPIPLWPPYTRLAAGPVALVGDAACQVYSPSGSGVGHGCAAASLLARAVLRHRDPDDALWSYNIQFQRRYGGTLAAFHVFHRFQRGLGPRGLETLVGSGALTPTLGRGGLEQALLPIPPREWRGLVQALLREPALRKALLPTVARMGDVSFLYHSLPSDPRLHARWERRIQALLRPGEELP